MFGHLLTRECLKLNKVKWRLLEQPSRDIPKFPNHFHILGESIIEAIEHRIRCIFQELARREVIDPSRCASIKVELVDIHTGKVMLEHLVTDLKRPTRAQVSAISNVCLQNQIWHGTVCKKRELSGIKTHFVKSVMA